MVSKKKARRKKRGFKGAFGHRRRKRASRGKRNFKGKKWLQRRSERGKKIRDPVERANYFTLLGMELGRRWK